MRCVEFAKWRRRLAMLGSKQGILKAKYSALSEIASVLFLA